MSIVASARVPRHLDLVEVDTRPINAAVDRHPLWCMYRTEADINVCGDIHMSQPVNVVATAGGFEIIDDGAAFPRVEIHATTLNGQTCVALNLFTPMGGSDWMVQYLTPETARTFAAGLHSLEDGQAVSTPTNGDQSVWCALAGGSARLVHIDHVSGRSLSARLRVDELRQVAAEITTAAAVMSR